MINERQMMELLQIVSRLKKQYTSCENSSITYEKAGNLMDCAMYCINQCVQEGTVLGDDTDMHQAYRLGMAVIEDKMRKTQEQYNGLVLDFKDYGCTNYKDTVLKGLPEFFMRYDPALAPMDNVIMLDYPLMKWSARNRHNQDCGIDLIEDYVKCLEVEKRFLNNYEDAYVVETIAAAGVSPSEYMGNICEEVLYRTVKDTQTVEGQKAGEIIMKLAARLGMLDCMEYLFCMSDGIDARISACGNH